jgi:hypothetical protein
MVMMGPAGGERARRVSDLRRGRDGIRASGADWEEDARLGAEHSQPRRSGLCRHRMRRQVGGPCRGRRPWRGRGPRGRRRVFVGGWRLGRSWFDSLHKTGRNLRCLYRWPVALRVVGLAAVSTRNHVRRGVRRRARGSLHLLSRLWRRRQRQFLDMSTKPTPEPGIMAPWRQSSLFAISPAVPQLTRTQKSLSRPKVGK